MSRTQRYQAALQKLGYRFEGMPKIGGDYVPVIQHADQVHVSGQIPRVNDSVVHPGRVGAEVSLADAQIAAQVSALRCLALLEAHLGSLERIRRLVRMNVFVQSASDFCQQSEVANAASAIFHQVLGEAGVHTRTSVGVYQLPKNAAVEIDLLAIAD
ncbi:RidA family protein [Pseudomonas sp. DTU_2021_1001937_2_SI_NGA_ILE_001]|uniref:RidA family protein n=1 Tax=Pseudomonas sp. DTU_2021_1001937_2_SI_NGA_ILE_001 TaxID=3077589 RepID=UPI0028FC0EF9|nr:RidA family protein [Pseudomonas sp. DTU_2021_1001937_2_SI_NGA_ILE_001]WNW13865.1 RidA family protein [Pseudomonas sp. DTU_2021_1001937_2_SI_NGA_ILE_001]